MLLIGIYIVENQLALVIPAAGRGSRFVQLGIREPKPLIELAGRPFFWWAVESIRRLVPLRQLIFVVLEEHVKDFSIDKIIKGFYPEATIVAIPEVTAGAAETARIGMSALQEPGPVAINDCDHAFISESLPATVLALEHELGGALMCFRSANPAYSYARFDASQQVIGTVEKQVVSSFAIAGCYLFADSQNFCALYDRYRSECPYAELFVSGMFNLLSEEKSKIGMLELDRHCSFGTPEEQRLVSEEIFAPFLLWK
jgi:dTDP-glucose pyrophosphorylase